MKHLSKSPWGFAERFCSQVILPRTQPERRPNLLGWASLPGWSRIPWKTPSEPLRSLVHSCITNLAILSCHLTSLRLIQVPRKLVNLHQNMPWNDTVRMCHWHIDSTICATPVSIWFIFTNFHSSIDISTQQMIKVHTNHFFTFRYQNKHWCMTNIYLFDDQKAWECSIKLYTVYKSHSSIESHQKWQFFAGKITLGRPPFQGRPQAPARRGSARGRGVRGVRVPQAELWRLLEQCSRSERQKLLQLGDGFFMFFFTGWWFGTIIPTD